MIFQTFLKDLAKTGGPRLGAKTIFQQNPPLCLMYRLWAAPVA